MNESKRPQLIIIFLTVFIYLMGFGIIIPITPMLGQKFGATPLQVGLLMSIYSVMQFLFAPMWGKLSDRIGRRPVLIYCMLGEGLSYILFALSRDLTMFFIARGLAGFFGASISTASAYISDITPPQERSKGMALIGAAFGLGFMVGPALGGALSIWANSISTEPFFDTSFSAYCVSVICFISFIFGWKFLKESLTEENKNHSQVKQKRIQNLLLQFKKPLIGALMFVFFAASMGMSAMESTLILYVGEKFAWTIKEVSFGFAYIGVIMVFTQGFLVRRILPLLGEKTVLIIGLCLFSVGMTSISFAPNITSLAISMTLLSLGTGCINPSILGSISLLTASNEQGATLGSTQSLASLGRIIGPALGGFLFGLSSYTPFIFSGLVGLIALGIVILIYSKLPQSGKIQGA